MNVLAVDDFKITISREIFLVMCMYAKSMKFKINCGQEYFDKYLYSCSAGSMIICNVSCNNAFPDQIK